MIFDACNVTPESVVTLKSPFQQEHKLRKPQACPTLLPRKRFRCHVHSSAVNVKSAPSSRSFARSATNRLCTRLPNETYLDGQQSTKRKRSPTRHSPCAASPHWHSPRLVVTAFPSDSRADAAKPGQIVNDSEAVIVKCVAWNVCPRNEQPGQPRFESIPRKEAVLFCMRCKMFQEASSARFICPDAIRTTSAFELAIGST